MLRGDKQSENKNVVSFYYDTTFLFFHSIGGKKEK